MNDDACDLLAQLVQANADAASYTSNQLLVSFKAERDAIFAGVSAALAKIPFGGTTADYERGFDAISHALYPSHERMDKFLHAAELWVVGSPEEGSNK